MGSRWSDEKPFQSDAREMIFTGSGLGLALASVSAVETAFSHAMVKAGQDKLAVQVRIRLVGLIFALPFVIAGSENGQGDGTGSPPQLSLLAR